MSEAPADSLRLRDADSLPVVVSVAELVSDIVLIRLACADSVSAAVVASEMVIVTLVAAFTALVFTAVALSTLTSP